MLSISRIGSFFKAFKTDVFLFGCVAPGNLEYRRSKYWSRFNMQGRSTGYLRESGPPDPVCLSFTHDRDYGVFKDYVGSLKEHQGEGWCPPIHAEYEGFMAEEALA